MGLNYGVLTKQNYILKNFTSDCSKECFRSTINENTKLFCACEKNRYPIPLNSAIRYMYSLLAEAYMYNENKNYRVKHNYD